MISQFKLLFLLSILTTCFFTSLSCFAIQYNIVDLGTLGGSGESKAYSINYNKKQEKVIIVGESNNKGFIWQDGIMTEIKDKHTNEIMPYAFAINDNDQIVGGSYLYDNGTITNLGADIHSQDINNNGEIVGKLLNSSNYFLLKDNNISYFAGAELIMKINDNSIIAGTAYYNGKAMATRWDNNQPQKLHELDPSYTYRRYSSAYDINNNGTVVGSLNGKKYPNYPDTSETINVVGAAKWDNNGKMTIINATNAYAVARGINDNGQIVGDFHDRMTSYTNGGFYWSEDLGCQKLNSLIENDSGWIISEVWDINDRGQVVGFGLNPDNEIHGFLLDPVDQWEYIAEAQDVLETDFSEMEIDNLYDLWASGKKDANPDPIEINEEIWEYFD